MSLRIVPADVHTASFSHIGAREKGAPSAPGLHDLLRRGVGPTKATTSPDAASTPDSAHPLEARLKQWEATREALRMETLRRAFGVAEPVRRGMELKITREGEWRPQVLRSAGGVGMGQLPRSVHEDILMACEATVEWEDVFAGDETRTVPGMHDEMERKLRM
ncbi:20S proteasome maturation protein [Grosmannia clavigera kw1407]|uniref:20S proteasome maturation protein n=1 Tax=Grosmannia clavigera (strain kw1407 / UAMH 11150) TaxID=655863 RepID=F0XSP9_GROCL|nr:20S proteasome maturation protein [Grosmannia clavigera kw1407]EFW99127.1 20S proteasome maturation protein [Grosmannia clavigera kw1407]